MTTTNIADDWLDQVRPPSVRADLVGRGGNPAYDGSTTRCSGFDFVNIDVGRGRQS